MNDLVTKLIGLLNAVADAYDIEYDGDEGKHSKAVMEAGIALDDFAMEFGREAASALEASGRDAARYRWLRSEEAAVAEVCNRALDKETGFEFMSGAELDAAIDSAITEQGKEGRQ